jgi:hypothetical protein
MRNFSAQKRQIPIVKKRRESSKPAIFWVQNLMVAKNLNIFVLNSMILFSNRIAKV